jgi:GT2 family glycosyltransferase
MDVSIVIVNWHSREHLKTCIASVLAHTRITYEIIVIDAASFDGCDRMLSVQYPEVRFIQSGANLGFARANNQASEESVGDCMLFLNPDTELVGPAIDTMHAMLTSLPKAGMVGCKLLNGDHTIQSSCIQSIPTIVNQLLDSDVLRAKWPTSSLWGTAALHDDSGGVREVEAISGACAMVKRSVFQHVGRFSEDYFMYAEDMDLSYKVRQSGYRNYYVPDATVIHYGGGSSDRTVSTFAAVMMPEAISRFLRKTRGRTYSLGYRCAMFASAVARLVALGVLGLLGRRGTSWEGSRHKWRAVLKWSVKLDDVVKRYYPRGRQPRHVF